MTTSRPRLPPELYRKIVEEVSWIGDLYPLLLTSRDFCAEVEPIIYRQITIGGEGTKTPWDPQSPGRILDPQHFPRPVRKMYQLLELLAESPRHANFVQSLTIAPVSDSFGTPSSRRFALALGTLKEVSTLNLSSNFSAGRFVQVMTGRWDADIESVESYAKHIPFRHLRSLDYQSHDHSLIPFIVSQPEIRELHAISCPVLPELVLEQYRNHIMPNLMVYKGEGGGRLSRVLALHSTLARLCFIGPGTHQLSRLLPLLEVFQLESSEHKDTWDELIPRIHTFCPNLRLIIFECERPRDPSTIRSIIQICAGLPRLHTVRVEGQSGWQDTDARQLADMVFEAAPWIERAEIFQLEWKRGVELTRTDRLGWRTWIPE